METSKCCSGVEVREENVELLKQFRANPLPLRTFLPLYQSMLNKKQMQSQMSSALRTAQHLAQQKPFYFHPMNCQQIKQQQQLQQTDKTLAKPRSKSCCSRNEQRRPASPKLTRATILRNQKSRNDLKAQNLEKKYESDVFEVKKTLAEKINVAQEESTFSHKLRQTRQRQRCQQLEYEKEIEEMKQRVKNRPLLIERQTQKAAVAKLEKDFQVLLKNEGLSRDVIDKYKNNSQLSDSYTSEDDEIDSTISEEAHTS